MSASTSSRGTPAGSGYAILTDPDQVVQGYYKVVKTANMTTTLAALNGARAAKDFRVVKFCPCSDVKKLEELLKPVLKSKLLPSSTEWIKVDETGLNRLSGTMEQLVAIANDQ